MNTNLEKYYYRYDSLIGYRAVLNDGFLKARQWTVESCPHKPLISLSEKLLLGESIYRISFWMSEPTLLRYILATRDERPFVAQRVKTNHPFFNDYIQEEDDHLQGQAWLFFNTEYSNKLWGSSGIPLSDIEVLDYDGIWKPYNQSEILQSHFYYKNLGWDLYTNSNGSSCFYKILEYTSGTTPFIKVVFAKNPFESLTFEVHQNMINQYVIPAFNEKIKPKYQHITDPQHIQLYAFDGAFYSNNYLIEHTFGQSAFIEVKLCTRTPTFAQKIMRKPPAIFTYPSDPKNILYPSFEEYDQLKSEFRVISAKDIYEKNLKLKNHIRHAPAYC